MSDNNNEYVSRPELESVDRRLSKEIVDNRTHIEEHSKDIARLEAVYKQLENLPSTIVNLDKTITIVSGNIETVSKSLVELTESVREQEAVIKEIKADNEKQSEDIEKIDSKSKIDIVVFIKDNFWKVLSAVAVGYVLVENILRKMGG